MYDIPLGNTLMEMEIKMCVGLYQIPVDIACDMQPTYKSLY